MGLAVLAGKNLLIYHLPYEHRFSEAIAEGKVNDGIVMDS